MAAFGFGMTQQRVSVGGGAFPPDSVFVLPASFAWSSVTFSRSIAGELKHDYDPAETRPIASAAAADHHYYVSASGDDTTGDGSESAPFKSLYKAIHNVIGNVWITPIGDLPFLENSAAGSTAAFTALVIAGEGARPIIGTRVAAGAWTRKAGTVNTYTCTVPIAVTEIWDFANLDAYGLAKRLPLSNATGELPNSGNNGSRRIIGGTTVEVRLPDNRVPDENVWIGAAADHIALAGATGRTVWINNVEFRGGIINITNSVQKSYVYINNCVMSYAAKAEDLFHNYGNCDSICFETVLNESRADGFGYNTGGARGIEINCGGVKFGNPNTGTNSIDNASTAHGGAKVIRFSSLPAPSFSQSEGRVIHDVGTGTATVNIGLFAGTTIPTDAYEGTTFVAGNPGAGGDNATQYLAYCTVLPGARRALGTQQQGVIYEYETERNGVSDFNTADVREWSPFE